MNFFEKELKRIMDHNSATYGHTYVGSTYYGTIDGDIRTKISFVEGKVSGKYDHLRVIVFNRVSGKLDEIDILFKDVFSNKKCTYGKPTIVRNGIMTLLPMKIIRLCRNRLSHSCGYLYRKPNTM